LIFLISPNIKSPSATWAQISKTRIKQFLYLAMLYKQILMTIKTC